VLKTPSNLALQTAGEAAATASLGNLGQGLTTLIVKSFILVSDPNFPSFSLKPFVLSLHALVQSPSPTLSLPLQVLAAALRSPCSLLQAEQPQLSAFPHSRGAPALGSLLWPPLALLQQACVFPVLRAPELDTGLQVVSLQSRVEG